jgi:alpha-beta hydrolase superfamily lysophospholipase
MQMDLVDFTFTSSDGLEIACYRWPHSATAVGIFQIAHGMGDYALRYEHVAEFMGAAGFEVYANDHRGHGRTAKDRESLGDFGTGGWNALVADMVTLTQIASSQYPQLPIILLGHGTGSVALQQYLLDHSQLLAGAVLSGSAALDMLQAALASGELTSLNHDFEPARTPYDWLTRDPVIVDAYLSDPLCASGIDTPALNAIPNAAPRLADPKQLMRIRSNLPIYILAGDKDPLNHHLEWVKALAERYRTAGLTNIVEQYYPGGRHEMLNEINRDEVLQALGNWSISVCGTHKRS